MWLRTRRSLFRSAAGISTRQAFAADTELSAVIQSALAAGPGRELDLQRDEISTTTQPRVRATKRRDVRGSLAPTSETTWFPFSISSKVI
jgi:hypothetical protein